MGHYIAKDGKIYVDTDFITKAGHLPGMEVKHMGFGEFSMTTPDGEVEFDRMRGKPFTGQSGRSHQMYDSSGGQKIAEKIVKDMVKHGKSALGTEPKEDDDKKESLSGLVGQLLSIVSPRTRTP